MKVARSPRAAMSLYALFTLLWVLMEEEIAAFFRQPYALTQVVWCRYATHLALIVLLFGWRGPRRPWHTNRPLLQLLRSACMLVMPVSFIAAIQQGAPADAVWSLFWVAPLLVLLIAGVWLPDSSASPRLWLVCAGCTAAAALMLWPQLRPFAWPAAGSGWPVAAATMALSFAIYIVLTRSLRGEPPLSNLFYSAVVPLVVLTPFVWAGWTVPSWHDALVLASIGAVGLVALWALDRGTAAAPLCDSVPALYAYLPLLALVEGGLHGVAPGRREWMMAAAIAAALAFVWWQKQASAPAPAAST